MKNLSTPVAIAGPSHGLHGRIEATVPRTQIKDPSARAIFTIPSLGRPGYVVDATIVSKTWPHKPHAATCAWLAAAPSGSLYVPAVVMEVIQRGIDLEQDREPGHAEELTFWRDTLPQAWDVTFVLPLRETGIMEIVDKMERTKQLNDMWQTSPRAKRAKIPHELFVAATSIAFGMKIVSLKTRGYLRIRDAGFPVPECVTPGNQTPVNRVARRPKPKASLDYLQPTIH